MIRGDRSHEMTAPADVADEPVRELGAFLHEPDGAVIRARLIGDVAGSLDAGMLDEHIRLSHLGCRADEPVRAVVPRARDPAANPKAINAARQAHGVGRIEIKKRGVDIDPAAFRKKLTLRGDQEATLILARIGDQRRAILAIGFLPPADRRRAPPGSAAVARVLDLDLLTRRHLDHDGVVLDAGHRGLDRDGQVRVSWLVNCRSSAAVVTRRARGIDGLELSR